MKLAIINQHASTGGWRYLYLLVEQIIKIKPEYDITIFTTNLTSKEDVNCLKTLNVNIKILDELSSKYFDNLDQPLDFGFIEKKLVNVKLINKYCNKIRRHYYKKKRRKARDIFNANDVKNNPLKDFDCIFYTWPYDIDFILTNKPVFFIPHDFIFSHFFGFHSGHIYNKDWYSKQKKQLQKLVDYGAKPIVSSDYIKDEYNRLYPKSEKKPSVVYLSSFNNYELLSQDKIKKVLDKFKIKNDYILYANNWALHKNMQSVIGAYYQVKQKYPNIKLIITGYGTDGLRCKCNTPYYLDHIEENDDYDVLSLGLLKNDDFSAVLQGAKMVINSSLCEAGSGSALDAWHCKIPVTFSNIPSFMQQLEFLGTKASVFDPRNSDSIAESILYILDNPEKVKEDVEISYKAIKQYNWEHVAKQYIDIFEQNMPSKDYQKVVKLYPNANRDELICYEELGRKNND